MTLAAMSGKLAAHSWMACTSRCRYSAAFSSSLFCVFIISFFSTITTCASMILNQLCSIPIDPLVLMTLGVCHYLRHLS